MAVVWGGRACELSRALRVSLRERVIDGNDPNNEPHQSTVWGTPFRQRPKSVEPLSGILAWVNRYVWWSGERRAWLKSEFLEKSLSIIWVIPNLCPSAV